jgi:hypothetical protein
MEHRFRYSFCFPFESEIIEKGEASKEKILEEVKSFPWQEELKKMVDDDDAEVFYSPSVEIENLDTKHSISVSAIGEPEDHEYMIFYNRPEQSMFGDVGMYEKDGLTWDDVMEAVDALLNNKTEILDNKYCKD